MPEKNSISFKRVLLIFLLICGVFWRQCDSQVMREEANKPPGDTRAKEGRGEDGGAFFALRSCHQLLKGDSGDFFSPDYLCSNPPLWCNWTIQVAPAKRIDLHLEDLTPDDACHLKDDQVHVDEPAGHFGGTNVLQKCWKEAKYTSFSNTLYVVLLIGGWPTPPYRGFYGRYQAFGPPVVAENHRPSLESYSQLKAAPTVESSTQVTSRWGREASQTPSDLSDSSVPPHQEEEGQNQEEEGQSQEEKGQSQEEEGQNQEEEGQSQEEKGQNQEEEGQSQEEEGQNQQLKPTEVIPTAAVEEASTHPEEATAAEKEKSADDKSRKEVIEASDQLPVSSEEPEPEETHPHPNMVEPLSDQRAHPRIRNHSDISHLPGDYLFEVAVELNFSPDVEESWDNLAMSLLLSVEALISKQLETLHTPLSMSSERIKRLSAGALFIVWLQLDQGPGGLQVHRTLHSALQGLISTHVGVRGNSRKAVILSVSTADVDECVSQLVRCDLNADCENRFGSYSCRCRSGFQDESRLGSAGTVCVNRNAAGCSSSSESRGVYGGLPAAGPRRTQQQQQHTNTHHYHADSELPPPPPPARGFRDVPLQRFSSLLPGGHGGKM
ncbi:Protein kinase C-binding protein NELL2 [Dissostichus eleginoides]|uniref:Protein kinase C-binding protein NELL2 n=1 Tax=Dissostichus eleginoides TaxID=100907 RepID=A0AAD9EYC6_DISEL|nr:Protein kinase C-binding protein NELL2 [Dissostichus eleginoides]